MSIELPPRPTSPAGKDEFHRTEPYAPSEAPGTAEAEVRSLFAMIQRPESMTVPIGGVWRPEEEEEAHQEYKKLLYGEEEEDDEEIKEDPDPDQQDKTSGIEQGNYCESDHLLLNRVTTFSSKTTNNNKSTTQQHQQKQQTTNKHIRPPLEQISRAFTQPCIWSK